MYATVHQFANVNTFPNNYVRTPPFPLVIEIPIDQPIRCSATPCSCHLLNGIENGIFECETEIETETVDYLRRRD